MTVSFTFLALSAILALASLSHAHFNARIPMPYNKVDCNPPECPGPCPPIWTRGNGKARNTPDNPSAVWKRGEEVDIMWHRNNHEGGYFRRSLVPVKYMNDKAWHKKTAFEWGCWEQGRYKCIQPGMSAFERDECGTDKKGFGYRSKMTVPKVFPDGDYVFGMVWYGGVHFKRKKPFFSDYYTCSYVTIRGGPLEAEYTPKFTPGTSHRKVAPGKCLSGKQFIGECGGEECPETHPVVEAVPGVFEGGKTPPKVLLKDLDSNAVVVPEEKSMSVLEMAPASEEQKALDSMKKEEQVDAKLVEQEMKEQMANKPIMTPSPLPSSPASTMKMEPVPESTTTGVVDGVEYWKGKVVPQWPTGSWGVKYSEVWKMKLAMFRARQDFCKANKDYPNCNVGRPNGR